MIPHSAENKRILGLAFQNGYDSEGAAFLQRIANDWHMYRCKIGIKFLFRPPRTIIFGPMEPQFQLLALHELSHAILNHRNYRLDIERVKMERDAWDKTEELAKIYDVDFDECLAQAELDTYREWLHQKSRCPKCGLTRFQTPDGQYHCPSCEAFKAAQKTR